MNFTDYLAGVDPICYYCGSDYNLQIPEDNYPVCDMCLHTCDTSLIIRETPGNEP